jgi:hypothetical protein
VMDTKVDEWEVDGRIGWRFHGTLLGRGSRPNRTGAVAETGSGSSVGGKLWSQRDGGLWPASIPTLHLFPCSNDVMIGLFEI